jgi:hypothetical protein
MRWLLRALLAFVVAMLVTESAAAQPQFKAVINGDQVDPPSGSPGTGTGCFALNPDNTLDYLVSYAGLLGTETAAHIHGPVSGGINPPVVFTFPLGSPKLGTFGPLNATQVADLSTGQYFVMIHTIGFPGGEIRGAIVLSKNPCAVPTEQTTWGAVKAFYDVE